MSKKLYTPEHFALKPTGFTLFMRTFAPWQFIRFLLVNLQMTKMILLSHDTRVNVARGRRDGEVVVRKAA